MYGYVNTAIGGTVGFFAEGKSYFEVKKKFHKPNFIFKLMKKKMHTQLFVSFNDPLKKLQYPKMNHFNMYLLAN